MKQYLDLLQKVLKEGNKKEDRTGVGTISYFATQTRYNLENNLPIITTKEVNFKAILHELLWFIKGDTNIRYLVLNDVSIWNDWPYQNFKNSKDYKNETMSDFVNLIKKDLNFAKKYGNLGPVYGKQWRDFDGKDQLKEALKLLKENPNSRRIIISAWNPNDVDKMLLPPCHAFFQFYVIDGKLSCQLYQRSADLFLGVPFNITSYSILTILIAHHLGLKAKEFIHTLGDFHIYKNHIEQVKLQIERNPYPLPKLKIKNKYQNLEDYNFSDFELINYKHHSKIVGKVAV
ncbi:Thymidylate synthase 2 [Candidatus Hepatoplasma crinochetorum Av]|uniref:Thymidylate synthase n=1 Tax=Candidatus Hepatoplasma crinochetorum Av TaxID=1427984 RepID=W8GS16_9MOLU|nr:thymidylate synthase [Candidatus Hepatoplasma crinochetorum]AHK22230.1 Thymidylate synthase 2 [Candidatus Hepatoplasma crinochetorum Av]